MVNGQMIEATNEYPSPPPSLIAHALLPLSPIRPPLTRWQLPDQDPLSNEGIPSARLPSVELSPASPSLVTTRSSSSGGDGSSGDASSSDGGVNCTRRARRKSVGVGVRPGGAIGAGWEEEKGDDGRAEISPALEGE